MKLRQLMLKAFGPFTNTTLDFSGEANLHVIYGPNEAGKSSALRAMGDLRYGVHARSTDGFLHGSAQLRVAGSFEDAAGRLVSLARRKGNKDTLLNADPLTGEPLLGSPVAPDVLLALTGGVSREQFVTMYGLDSAHLRAGGEQLIRGDGELGAALFEASTGSASIKATLEALQLDARKLHTPRGASTVLGEAARQLDEARQRYKQALTKPEQWKSLHRAHEESLAQLAQVKAQLARQRRRQAELIELRGVEPVLRELDLAREDWQVVQHHVELPASAREQRLAALQQHAHATQVMQEADETLGECARAAHGLQVEEALLTHRRAIERLGSELTSVRRDAETRNRLAASIAAQSQQLRLQATRMTEPVQPVDSLEALFIQIPTEADQAQWQALIDQSQTSLVTLQHAQTQRQSSAAKLGQLQREPLAQTPVELEQALSLALAQAQTLGNADQRLADMASSLEQEQHRLERAWRDLGLESAAQLQQSRGLASSEIDTFERQQVDLHKRLATGASQVAQLQADIATQKQRLKKLAATGEVVTADSLRSARLQRDANWQAVRTAFIDGPAETAPPFAPDDLPATFERTQTEADRQADLLREGAQRAAEVAECEQRTLDMSQALLPCQARHHADTAALAQLEVAWQQTLAQRGLPPGGSALVREWLMRRQSALELLERQNAAALAHRQLALQVGEASTGLSQALAALGLALPVAPQSLAVLVALGTQRERDLLAAKMAITQRTREIGQLSQAHQEAQDHAATLEAALLVCRQDLDRVCQRLFLLPGTSPEAIKARLQELQRWSHDYQLHGASLLQLQQLQASESALTSAARDLGQLLQEPNWSHLDAWFDALSQRLGASLEAQTRRTTLNDQQTAETRRRQGAGKAQARASQDLAQLMARAGVSDPDELAQAETRAEHRREVQQQIERLQSQLTRISAKDTPTLRVELAELDSVAIDLERQNGETEIESLQTLEQTALTDEQTTRQALAAVDTSAAAANAREDMESAVARYRAGVRPWAQLKLAHALLDEALRRYREQAQGPLIQLAGEYFKAMTDGRFISLWVDDDSGSPVLKVRPPLGAPVPLTALSEGTADQLYLALRLAALQVQRQPDRMMPLVLDDVFMTSDDERAAHMLRALAQFAAQGQVLVFTHHPHLLDIARRTVAPSQLRVHQLPAVFDRTA